MQIPDLTKMQVNTRVPEAMVSHLRNQESSDDPASWQHAQIKIDAFPTRVLHGHVKTVDTVASSGDWFASDVKNYKTIVTIDQHMEGLKPGMSAEVTIFANESPTPVLVVPIQAVLGTISMGAERKVFVVRADGQTDLRDIVVGMSNERLVEIKSGLSDGEQVVLDPRSLLKEDSDLKPGKTRSNKPPDEEQSRDQGGEPEKKSGKKGGKKKGELIPAPGSPGTPIIGGQGGGPGGGPGDAPQQAEAWLEMMGRFSAVQRREWINTNIHDTAARSQARQKLHAKGLEVPD